MTAAGVSRWDALTVAIVAKECRPGRVKTRLCPPLLPEQAAELAATSLAQTMSTVRDLPVRQRVLFFDGDAAGAGAPDDAAAFTVLPQPGGGLDERLAHLCATVTGPLMIIGMDTPQLAPTDLTPLRRDWARPDPEADAWFGPAADGGFWALALAEPAPELIRGVPMSVERTGAEQRSRLVAAGLRVGDLGTLRDVDVVDDAVDVAGLCPGTPFARLCDQWGLTSPAVPGRHREFGVASSGDRR
ncbi:DUF2064 domain-containing protein [Tersicoccus sp. MR15.9]|uniref:TIGR04282 family arsenosugar biosynthesis glycosyltransferase n=1 Tax=Tersicoccus mangrovi TaxID=3121635 RepID=UPI002FE62E37